MFVPVKVQTGYINIISSDVALTRNIIPTTGGTRTVDLYEITPTGNKLLWQGYVEPQMLSMKIWQGPQKLKIPVECPLSALKYTPFSSQKGTMTIAELLYGLTTDFTRVYIQGTPIGPSTSTTIFTTYSWLGKKIYPSLFTSASMADLYPSIYRPRPRRRPLLFNIMIISSASTRVSSCRLPRPPPSSWLAMLPCWALFKMISWLLSP